MSDSTASLQRKISSAGELQAVVRTMKAVAASSVGQYENSVRALADYSRTVDLGLSICFRTVATAAAPKERRTTTAGRTVGAVVFGSDQGLVGRFNDAAAEFAVTALAAMADAPQVWAVGERVQDRLVDAGLSPVGTFAVPTSVKSIAPLVAQVLVETESPAGRPPITELYLFYHRPTSGAVYAPVSQRLLPLDDTWRRTLSSLPWPTHNVPEVMGDGAETLRALIREYLFVSLFRACAESLASENASRLSAMERADRNIDDLLEYLQGTFHRLRQGAIDEELFDVIAGFEALKKPGRASGR